MLTIIASLLFTVSVVRIGKMTYDKVKTHKLNEQKKIAYDNSLGLIESNNLDAISNLVNKEVLFKAYILIRENLDEDNDQFLCRYNDEYKAKEIVFYSKKKNQHYHLVQHKGLYQRGSNYLITYGLNSEIQLGDTIEQQNFWNALFTYVEKRIVERDNKRAIAKQEQKRKEQEELEIKYF